MTLVKLNHVHSQSVIVHHVWPKPSQLVRFPSCYIPIIVFWRGRRHNSWLNLKSVHMTRVVTSSSTGLKRSSSVSNAPQRTKSWFMTLLKGWMRLLRRWCRGQRLLHNVLIFYRPQLTKISAFPVSSITAWSQRSRTRFQLGFCSERWVLLRICRFWNVSLIILMMKRSSTHLDPP